MDTTFRDTNARRLVRTEKVFTKMPEGWTYVHGSSAPRGYMWISNGKSIFGGEYQHALLKTA